MYLTTLVLLKLSLCKFVITMWIFLEACSMHKQFILCQIKAFSSNSFIAIEEAVFRNIKIQISQNCYCQLDNKSKLKPRNPCLYVCDNRSLWIGLKSSQITFCHEWNTVVCAIFMSIVFSGFHATRSVQMNSCLSTEQNMISIA